MSGRQEMLARVRRALGRPEAAGGSAPGQPVRSSAQPPRLEGVMPPILPEDRLTRFELEFRNVGGSPHRASTALELEGILRTIISGAAGVPGSSVAGGHPVSSAPVGSAAVGLGTAGSAAGGSATARASTRGAQAAAMAAVVLTRNPLLEEVKLSHRLRAWGLRVSGWPESAARRTAGRTAGTDEAQDFRDQCFAAAVGISGVDFLLAESGSLVLSSQTEGSQLASLAPPVHVALYRRAQVLSSLDEVLENFALSSGPGAATAGRSIVFITGTSRTADIEQILVRGVHGPREVHGILVEESCVAELAAAVA